MSVTKFRPGNLRHRLVLEQLAETSDGGGGFTQSWTEVAELWAAIRPISGSEQVESGRMAGTITHELVLRYRTGVVPAMRFRNGARVFQVLAVINVDERGVWLKCLCEERDL